MYSLPEDIKGLLVWTVRISALIIVLLTPFGFKYQICFTAGAILSIVNLLKNNIFITNAIYKQPHKAQKLMIFSYLLTYAIFVPSIVLAFLLSNKNVWCAVACLVGLFMVKIMVIIIFGINRKEGDKI